MPAALTVYFIAIYVGAANGAEWALNNPTYVHMNSWFHYANISVIPWDVSVLRMLKYMKIGKTNWFKVFPFVIVAINILIAVVSDFESGVRGKWPGRVWGLLVAVIRERMAVGRMELANGIAGILKYPLCMTGWWESIPPKTKRYAVARYDLVLLS